MVRRAGNDRGVDRAVRVIADNVAPGIGGVELAPGDLIDILRLNGICQRGGRPDRSVIGYSYRLRRGVFPPIEIVTLLSPTEPLTSSASPNRVLNA